MDADWRALALAPVHAFGPPPACGRLRTFPEDFHVEEELGFAPDGAGAHLLLKVEKRGANTEWVARELARALGCAPRDVGYAGLKDRHAVCVQWFSVPASSAAVGLGGEGYRVLEVHAHRRKLPRGALAGNRFRIRVRDLGGDRDALRQRLAVIHRRGVPNYFGAQRFGHAGANLTGLTDLTGLAGVGAAGPGPGAGVQGDSSRLAPPAGTDPLRPSRPRRRGNSAGGFRISAARSLVFNAVAAARVADGSWERLEAGDLVNLDGRGSFFAMEAITDELRQRCADLALHPTGPLWGRGAPPSGGAVRLLEEATASRLPAPCALTVAAGLRQERRSLRVRVQELAWELSPAELLISFRLGRGSFATAVLRELIDAAEAAQTGAG